MINILVLSGYGLNCEEETLVAFVRAGCKLSRKIKGRIVHINEVIASPRQLQDANILVLPGGFSYGDHTGSGNAFALRLLNNLQYELQEFLLKDKLVLGICNGCQILVKLIPEFKDLSLIKNKSGQYECRWVKVATSQRVKSFWLDSIDTLYIPVAHGEGQFYMSKEQLNYLIQNDNIALRYLNSAADCFANESFPDNPNGSVFDIAALSDSAGKVLAMMPHPERAMNFTQMEDWTLRKEKYIRIGIPMPQDGDGLSIFCNAVRYFY